MPAKTTTTLLQQQASSPALLFGGDIISSGGSSSHDENSVMTTRTQVIVHPTVLLQILDHHTRRQEATGRVIGTLLGQRRSSTDGSSGGAGTAGATATASSGGTVVVEITNCFAVPHAERGDEVAIGKDFNKTMLNLHLRTNRKEVVVGWYATAAGAASSSSSSSDNNNNNDGDTTPLIADTSSLIHDFYSGETEEGDPVHLVVDTRLQTDQLSIRAYKSLPIVLQGGEPVGNLFHELSLQLRSSEAEAICMNEMIMADDDAAASGGKPSDADALQVSMEKLYELLETALQYVDQVVDGKIPPDAEAGKQIADTLATLPRIRPEVFDKLFHDSLQDLLMVTYLSNITRTQSTIAEKLNASLGVTK